MRRPCPGAARRLIVRAVVRLGPRNGPSEGGEALTPIAAIESQPLAAGKPIVATHVVEIQEVIADSETGLLVPPDDPSALAGALLRLRFRPPGPTLFAPGDPEALHSALVETLALAGRRRPADLAVSPAGDEALLALYRRLALSTGRRG